MVEYATWLKYCMITQTLLKPSGAPWEWTDEMPWGGNETLTLASGPVSPHRNALTPPTPYIVSASFLSLEEGPE